MNEECVCFRFVPQVVTPPHTLLLYKVEVRAKTPHGPCTEPVSAGLFYQCLESTSSGRRLSFLSVS